eukprot:Blabericola_migrator_1__2149@NODE_1593_length_4212_cov_36_797829_g1041_i0_p1_GENE_NODE_1593_length_4212_cov_36_797829_g1041_i0NODE_1593_length_4212_cov_36_797829_g1041_i0_p1_ORF_typecomplete_len317_score41_11Fboxlike/PF12937_7/0_13_NODE_1593_length_4212_cov_36_797829_g1041_i031104060
MGDNSTYRVLTRYERVQLIIPFLDVHERFKIGQTCRAMRDVVLSAKYEQAAFMRFLELSVLFKRPWAYFPFPQWPRSASDDLRTAMGESRLICLKKIRTWHCLFARSANLAPWTINIQVDMNMRMGSLAVDACGTKRSLAQTIAHDWYYSLDAATSPYRFHPRWLIWLIGQMRASQINTTHLFSVYSMLRVLMFGTDYDWYDGYRYLGTDLANVTNKELFSYKFATTKDKGMMKAPYLTQPMIKWLESIASEWVIPRMLKCGFKPLSTLEQVWSPEMTLKCDTFFVSVVEDLPRCHIYGQNHCCLEFDTSYHDLQV